MKGKGFITIVALVLVIGCLSGQAASAAPGAPEERVIPYPPGYVTDREGASAYKGAGNVRNSPYYAAVDIYGLTSQGGLTVLPRYRTYQQTTEYTCGPAAALTVLHYFDNTVWDELAIAKVMATHTKTGTPTSGMVKFFQSIGWDVHSSLEASTKAGRMFADLPAFTHFVAANLQNNTPIMVENVDWAGHWRVIIGYDTMGTDTLADDVLIMADSYDTADHWQDGYVIVPAEKFFYTWYDSHLLPAGQKYQQWLTVVPPRS